MSKHWVVSLKELRWLQSAVSSDGHRLALTAGMVTWFDGCSWLAATDTWRLHLLRLGRSKQHEQQTLLFDRLIMEAELANVKHVGISHDFSTAIVGDSFGDEIRNGVDVAAPLTKDLGKIPAIPKVVPSTREPVDHFAAFNIKFLADAMALASSDQNKVVIYGESKNQAHVIQPDDPEPRWVVVLMPMALSAWWGLHEGGKGQAMAEEPTNP